MGSYSAFDFDLTKFLSDRKKANDVYRPTSPSYVPEYSLEGTGSWETRELDMSKSNTHKVSSYLFDVFSQCDINRYVDEEPNMCKLKQMFDEAIENDDIFEQNFQKMWDCLQCIKNLGQNTTFTADGVACFALVQFLKTVDCSEKFNIRMTVDNAKFYIDQTRHNNDGDTHPFLDFVVENGYNVHGGGFCIDLIEELNTPCHVGMLMKFKGIKAYFHNEGAMDTDSMPKLNMEIVISEMKPIYNVDGSAGVIVKQSRQAEINHLAFMWGMLFAAGDKIADEKNMKKMMGEKKKMGEKKRKIHEVDLVDV